MAKKLKKESEQKKETFMRLRFVLLFLFSSISINAADHFISFIIPCYNCQSWVEEAIESIYEQELKFPFEVICTDDGSSDNTIAVLKKCQSKHQNLYVHIHEKNKGGGAARNTCVSHSQGDLIFCLDADNVLCPRSINQLIDVMDQEKCDVVSFAEGKAFKGNYVYMFSFYYTAPGNRYDLYTWSAYSKINPAYGGNYLFTRKSYDRAGGYPEDIGCADTFGFGVAQLATGSVMRTAPCSFYWHRLHNDSYYMREAKKNTTDRDTCKSFHYFSEVFSPSSQKLIAEKSDQEIWALFENRKLPLASHDIIQSLFKAYEYKYQKRYADAAHEFSNAVTYGCTSKKIYQFIEEMHKLSQIHNY